MDLRGKHVMVLGLGVSGRAVAQFTATRSARLVLTDTRTDLSLSNLPDAEFHLGGESAAWLAGVELIVVSPGVPPSSLMLQSARARGIPVIGELELASRFVDFPLVAVTGTNGKSTVTTLIGQICREAGLSTFIGGNLGTPLISAAGEKFDIGVVETSSYQLETIEHFKPAVAIHLNLTADHLDRYDDLEQYGLAKARIFENQDAGDWAVLNRDDSHVWKLAHQVRSRVLSFGLSKPSGAPAIWEEHLPAQSTLQGSLLGFNLGDYNGTIRMGEFRLPGAFNRSNAMAAAGAALALKLKPESIERTLAGFHGLAHRLEFVREKDGVIYLDDSKGTNVGAVVQALSAVAAPVILIAGGVDKGGSYLPLRKPLRQKVKKLILYGAARETMRAALNGAAPIECVESMAEAVRIAAAQATRGDTVLLSPACASFDQFENYAARGRVFQNLVLGL